MTISKRKLSRIEDFIAPRTFFFYRCNRHLLYTPCNQEVVNIFFYSTSKTNYTVVRPLINCSRRTITMTCLLSQLPVYPDISNLKVRYSRNRIRKQIIPSIQFFFNPKVEKTLFKFSEFYNHHIYIKKKSLY